MAGFTWHDAERVIRFGAGALAEAPGRLEERGFEGYALLTTRRARRHAPDLVAGAATVLDVPSGLVPDAAAALADDARGHPLVALGGGRVVDAAKALAAADGTACAAVPTTLAGSPLTRIHRLPSGVSGVGLVRPSLVVAEPALMASQPMPSLAASAMNALAHAVESLYVPLANPVAEMAALRAAALIARALAPEEPVREDLALGAVLAAWAVGSTGYAVHHPVCQTLVAVAGTPHAETNAVLLPHSVRAMGPRAPEVLGRLALALGAPAADPEAAAERIASVAARAGPTALGDLGVGEAQIPDLVETVASRPELANTPGGPPSEQELAALIRSAL